MSDIDRRYDVLVIGSGPAGSSAVQELTERGLDVLLLDAGREVRESDFVPPARRKPKAMGMDLVPRATAMLRGQYVQALRPYFSETSNRFLVRDVEEPYTTPFGRPYLWVRSKLVGGRMHSYGRMLQRMSDVDFKAASLDGHGSDWPLSYADLEPWYDKVEDAVGVYGDADGLVHPPDSRYRGPGFLTSVERHFKRHVESRWPERRVISGRLQAHFPDRVPPGIAAGLRTGRLTVRPEAVVTRIVTHQRSGLATGAVFVDRRSRREHRVYADAVVVAGSTIESLRLLLASGSSRHPDGLGNSSGLLGRYFMDQTISVGFFDAPQFPGGWDPADNMPPDPYYGVPGGVLIPRYENLAGRTTPGFVRGISFQGIGGRFPVPDGHPAAFGLGGAGEMLARYDNRVSLSRLKDRWGMHVPHIDITMGDNDRVLLKRSMTALKEMADEAGFRTNFIGSAAGLEGGRIWPDFNPVQRFIFRQGIKMSIVLGAAIHETGGARMGSDPRSSVLDEHNRLWDAPNVVVADAACFVSGSTVGPALTIMALAARASAHLAEVLEAGDPGR